MANMPKKLMKITDVNKLRQMIMLQQVRLARQSDLIDLQRNRIEWSDDTCRRVMLRLERVYAGKDEPRVIHAPDQSRSRTKGRTTV